MNLQWRDRIQVSFKISSFVFEYESLLGLDWREGEYIVEFLILGESFWKLLGSSDSTHLAYIELPRFTFLLWFYSFP